MKGNLLTFAGRHDEAIAQFERTIELYPESPIVRFNLAEAYSAKGMRAEAIEHFLAGLQLDGASNYELRRYKGAFKLKGWNGFWMEHLATMINLERAVRSNKDRSFFDNEGLAYAYAAVNNNDKAIEYLYKAYEAREPSIVTIANSEVYDGLRSDARFQELISKIGLPR
jgi:tetratricopeptide (TPR) repeat protein